MAEPLDVQDLALRATAAAQQWSDGCVVEDVTFLPGGTVSLVYTASVRAQGHDEQRVVLKVAPPGLPPVRNRDVLRQARSIDALNRAPGVAVPAVLFSDQARRPRYHRSSQRPSSPASVSSRSWTRRPIPTREMSCGHERSPRPTCWSR